MSLINPIKKIKRITYEERQAHQSWCFKNDVKIELIPRSYSIGFIVINDKGNVIEGMQRYKLNKLKPRDAKWWDKVWELYTEYYNKYNKDETI